MHDQLIMMPALLVLYLASLMGNALSIKRIVGESGFGVDISDILGDEEKKSSSFISSGFISAQYDMNTPLTIHIKKKINRPGICYTIELTETPQPNHSPLVGSSKMNLDFNEMHNGRYAYTNGKEYMSFIAHEGELGNWLIGNTAGVDSGYVYLPTSQPGFIPVGHEDDDTVWKWLQKGKWEEFPDMQVVCADAYYADQPQSERHYFTIEYFDPVTNEPEHSVLVPDFNPFLFAKQEGKAEDERSYKVPGKIVKKKTDGKFAAYLNNRTGKWVLLHSIKTIAAMGALVMVTDTSVPQEHVCVLVKEEHGGQAGWRLSLKHATTPLQLTTEQPYHQVVDEYLVEVNSNGVEPRYKIAELSSSVSEVWWGRVALDLSTVKVGDYLWTWLAPVSGEEVVPTESIFEALIKCVAVREETLGDRTVVTSLYEYYDSDRGEVLRQTLLSRDTELVQIKITKPVYDGGKNSKYAAPDVQYKGVKHQLHSSVSLGSDIIGFVRRYLVNKEGHPHGMSSCYMYHAAVSMPQVLVYAAEIVCVLIGAKPLTMVNTE